MDLEKEALEYLKANPEEIQFSETLNLVVESIPGAMKKLKSIDSEIEKLTYLNELCAIALKLDEFQEGKGIPN